MLPTKKRKDNDWSTVNLAFSKQADHFDVDDLTNPILQSWRKRIYKHVNSYLKPGDSILELNAGTGIDALYFARKGHPVLATDLSVGMIRELKIKIARNQIPDFSCRQISFENLDQLGNAHFDYVFSNFGGLNCIRDLSLVARHLPGLLQTGAYVTWVIMPRFSPWELLWFFKGKWGDSFRRFQKEGTTARLEGERFQTYYHSLADVRKALGSSFQLVKAEGLGIFSAPPAATSFYNNHPRINNRLKQLEAHLADRFPFNRWGDHIIVTFRLVL